MFKAPWSANRGALFYVFIMTVEDRKLIQPGSYISEYVLSLLR